MRLFTWIGIMLLSSCTFGYDYHGDGVFYDLRSRDTSVSVIVDFGEIESTKEIYLVGSRPWFNKRYRLGLIAESEEGGETSLREMKESLSQSNIELMIYSNSLEPLGGYTGQLFKEGYFDNGSYFSEGIRPSTNTRKGRVEWWFRESIVNTKFNDYSFTLSKPFAFNFTKQYMVKLEVSEEAIGYCLENECRLKLILQSSGSH